MARHKAARRSLRDLLRVDLHEILGPKVVVRLIRQEPGLLWWLLLYLVITFGFLVAALAVLGRLHSFTSLAIYPCLLAGSSFGGRLLRRRDALKLAAARAGGSNPAATESV